MNELFKWYFSSPSGLFFPTVHAAIVLGVVVLIGRLVGEGRALAAWRPGQLATRGISRSSAVLLGASWSHKSNGVSTEAIQEGIRGAQGVIDSAVSRIHDLVNALLVVGIAGTVNGLFVFAQRQEKVTAAQSQLREALLRALPVVLIGLALYVVFLVLLLLAETFVRGALTESVARVLAAASAATPEAQLRDALAPLADLKMTLNEIVAPVIDAWGKNIGATYQLATNQVAALETAVQSIGSGVGTLNELVEAVRSESQRLRDVIKEVPNTLAALQISVAEQVRALRLSTDDAHAIQSANANLAEKLSTTTTTLGDAASRLNEVPTAVAESIGCEMQRVLDTVSEAATRTGSSVEKHWQSALAAPIARADAMAQKVVEASTEWKETATISSAILKEAFEQALQQTRDAVGREALTLDLLFAQKFPDALQRVDAAAEKWSVVAQQLVVAEEAATRLLMVKADRAPASSDHEATKALLSLSGEISHLRADVNTLPSKFEAALPFPRLRRWLRGSP